MNYNLNSLSGGDEKKSTWVALKNLLFFLKDERSLLILAFGVIIINSTILLLGPLITGHAIDLYIRTRNFPGLLVYSGLLVITYLVALVTGYFQTRLMGTVSQRMLFSLRNSLFKKLLELPVSFFNQNKVGDLISRINNDTDKINQFFSQSLVQFVGGIARMLGSGIFLLAIQTRLGGASLVPAILIWVITLGLSPWVKKVNALNLKKVGGLSAEIQESLNNFKTIIAFNRRDYFRNRFKEANLQNYSTAVRAGVANNIFMPIYGFFTTMAQLIVLVYGIYLISHSSFTVGFLLSYLLYVNQFYDPLRQLAALWASFQVAMASWDRISVILNLHSDLLLSENVGVESQASLLEFRHVYFSYSDDKEILHNISLKLEKGKKYALVGPTGGGKTTTASLMDRLYDAQKGDILFQGQDIRSFSPEELSKKVGFILQEPFLFSGTVRENILYGNPHYPDPNQINLEEILSKAGWDKILSLFDQGLDTPIQSGSENISLGQRQLIAFMRAVLRNPELLILDEATANIDTITEQWLDEILNNLPKDTTQVIIAHRLNTIQNADEIFFVNSGEVIPAGSFDKALDLLMHNKRSS
jgi:ATP-binding cassette subfamily B protein